MGKKMEIVKALVAAGYHLMGESEEHFANRFSEEVLQMFLENFQNWKS